ncbi:MAG TPA: hypothetical protein VLE53_17225 [Gemmatimonadaceae bacterium]|nr:hypothetical protein [Gemmatimonadaceae bacterium]
MKSLLRAAVATSIIAVSASIAAVPAQAQNPLELRADLFRFQTADGNSLIQLAFPGAFAMAFYMNQQVAIEPGISISRFEDDDDDSLTLVTAGLFLPIHFQAGGRQGFFLSPGIEVTHTSADVNDDTLVNYGLDLGFKWSMRERISSRLAFTVRDGDSFDDPVLGASFGLGFFWR